MYDKYLKVTPITIGSQVKNNKGILFSNSSTNSAGVTMYLYSTSGTTLTTCMHVAPSGSSIFPVEVNAVPLALPNGITGFFVF